MRPGLCTLLVTAAASIALSAQADETTEPTTRQRLAIAAPVPVYCRNDANAMARLDGVDFRSLYGAFASKLGWPGRIERVTPKGEEEYVVAAFEDAWSSPISSSLTGP